MPNTVLREFWATSLRHLAAARYYLPEKLPSQEAMDAERDRDYFLHHNELGLAIEAAEDLGLSCNAPPEFWRELRMAAINMDMKDFAERYALLENS